MNLRIPVASIFLGFFKIWSNPPPHFKNHFINEYRRSIALTFSELGGGGEGKVFEKRKLLFIIITARFGWLLNPTPLLYNEPYSVIIDILVIITHSCDLRAIHVLRLYTLNCHNIIRAYDNNLKYPRRFDSFFFFFSSISWNFVARRRPRNG